MDASQKNESIIKLVHVNEERYKNIVENRTRLYNSYKFAENCVVYHAYVITGIAIILDGIGVALNATNITPIGGLIMSGICGGLTGLVTLLFTIANRLRTKAEKHKLIAHDGTNKLDCLYKVYARATADKNISDDEFTVIQETIDRINAFTPIVTETNEQ